MIEPASLSFPTRSATSLVCPLFNLFSSNRQDQNRLSFFGLIPIAKGMLLERACNRHLFASRHGEKVVPLYRARANAGTTGATARPMLEESEPESKLSDTAGFPASNTGATIASAASSKRVFSFAFSLCRVFKEASLRPLHAPLATKT